MVPPPLSQTAATLAGEEPVCLMFTQDLHQVAETPHLPRVALPAASPLSWQYSMRTSQVESLLIKQCSANQSCNRPCMFHFVVFELYASATPAF